MGNTKGEGCRYACICVFLSWKQIHTKYTARYTLLSLSPPSGINPRRRAQWTAMPPVESDEDSENSGDEREGDEQEVALSEAAILRLMA